MSDDENKYEEDEFPHPFVDRSYNMEEPRGMWAPRAILELKMYQLSATLREKPEWWRKARDPEIRKKWVEEARAQQAGEEKRWRLSDKMCGPYDCIWGSDKLIPGDVRAELEAAVKPFEDVPDAQKDWHPGSDGQVLDLVHPSLYPLVYEKTLGKQPDGTIGTFDPPDPILDKGPDDAEVLEGYVSTRFQWLPSDFRVEEDGSVRLTSSYINDVPPEYAPRLIPAIEHILARAVPLWERVLSDLRRGEPPMRVGPVIQSRSGYGARKGLDCVWSKGEPRGVPEEGEDGGHGDEDGGAPSSPVGQPAHRVHWEDERARRDAWYARQPITLPEMMGEYEPDGAAGLKGREEIGGAKEGDGEKEELGGPLDGKGETLFSLEGRTIQVITKLANIVLTPEKPAYPGGTWHVEGMWNERIVSTFIYYYDSENIQDTTLAFRQATSEPLYHRQDDVFCMWTLYRLERDKPCVQEIGSIPTKKGRCIAFPNLFQHKVSPFKLVDPTKPGMRKIIVFFLVDPTRRIPSATDVAPQQEEWLKSILHIAKADDSSRLSTMPLELLDAQADLVEGIMTKKEALEIREELMKERSVRRDEEGEEFEEDDGLFSMGFNMCEH
ncbi:hypothetical protein K525DRAFT_268692 [Schizophyllum commune Loenen D]|nr:hypothetical protein K525DRAFT_268692 [Schizophyllum commune Loenen D]